MRYIIFMIPIILWLLKYLISTFLLENNKKMWNFINNKDIYTRFKK